MALVEETGNAGNVAISSHAASFPLKTEESPIHEPAGGKEAQEAQSNNILPGLGMHPPFAHSQTDRSYDYTKKYPADQAGKELKSEGRFWKVYLDESENYDSDTVLGFRNTIDATLVFAALFSSVVTSFVIESSQKLEPNYAQINVSLLVENNLLLRAGGNASKIEAVPQSSLTADSVTHSPEDVWMAWMFFTSLSLALVASLLSILVKQWLQAFTTIIPGDAKERCLIRQLRFTGLKKWKVSEIINALPLFLHVSLALFLVGLGLFVRDFDLALRIVVDVIACGSYLFYLITVTLAAIHVECPYRLPILYNPVYFVLHFLRQLLFSSRRDSLTPFLSSTFLRERRLVLTLKHRCEALAIQWLFRESTNASVQHVSLEAATRFLEEFIGPNDFEGRVELRRALYLLPLDEICSFALRLLDSVPHSLRDASPSTHFLVTLSSVKPDSFPPDVWRRAFESPKLLDALVEHRVPIDVMYPDEEIEEIEAYPLQHACQLEKWDVVAKLIPRSPRSHLAGFGPYQQPPLTLACMSVLLPQEKRLTIVHLLLQQGSDVGERDYYGWNTLHRSVSNPKVSTDVLEALLLSARNTRPAAINERTTEEGNTPLLLACAERALSSIRVLLLAQADANISDNLGQAPLHLVCRSIADFTTDNDFTLFEMLVGATGVADLSRQTQEGVTPLDVLVSNRHACPPETFKRAYRVLRAKGAWCNKELELQEKIDCELEEDK